MEKTPTKVCAFCGQKAGRELGGLQNTSDQRILAHHNCLIFSPLVVTNDSDDEDEVEFDIQSVLEEIKRGKTLKCSYCKKSGATIGCDIKRCQKTYHYQCVRKDEGITDDDKYIVWCSKHAKHSDEDTERSRTPDRSSPSHENETPGKKKRKSEPSPPQGANKKSKTAQDTGRSGSSEVSSPSHDNKTQRRRTRNSEPGPSQGTNKKSKAAQDTGRSGSSEVSSPSHDNKTQRKRNRDSEPGVYSVQLENNKSNVAEEIESIASSSSSSSHETPKTKRKSKPGKISKQNVKYTRRISDHSEDEETNTNDASSGSNLKTTESASSVTPPARRGRPPKRRRQEAARPQSRLNTSTAVDSELIQQSDVGAEREEMNAQPRSTEDGSPAQGRNTEDGSPAQGRRAEEGSPAQGRRAEEGSPAQGRNTEEGSPAQGRNTEEGSPAQGRNTEEGSPAQGRRAEDGSPAQGRNTEEGSPAQGRNTEKGSPAQGRNTEEGSPAQGRSAESKEKRSTPLSHHTLNNVCIPSTSQACCDKSEAYFLKLYESQCRIANSIESGVSEFRSFAQQFQIMFKQFLDVCQSLNHGISSNLTNADKQNTSLEVHQNTSLEVHHRQDGTADTLPPIQLSSHIPVFTHDSAKNGETSSSGNTLPSNAEEQSRKTRSSLPGKKGKR